ncbi:MAG: hypothetical protein M5R36_11700 [Deltaproteobacteria bacterium]|nr:hypothetical protein [Deltaproteobacteria bacterium]
MKTENNTDILTCWQEIADYLERSVRTCQRWTKTKGLPVRFPAGYRSSPCASRRQLDAWRLAGQNTDDRSAEDARRLS